MDRLRARTGAADAALVTLLDRVGPVIAQTVDALQVAALLEADGITDAIAQDRYGFEDVFKLAAEVRRRCVPGPNSLVPGQAAARQLARGSSMATSAVETDSARFLSHGLLYLLPVAIFPSVLAFLSARALILGLVAGAGVAWVWAGATTWIAYRSLSAQRPAAADRVLKVATVAGLPVAFVIGLVLAIPAGGGLELAVVACAQMAYQMSATVLMFHHRERVLMLAMLPTVLVGVLAILSPRNESLSAIALVVAALSVVVIVCLAILRTGPASSPAVTRRTQVVSAEPVQLVLVITYTALTAAYLLHAQSRYLFGSIDETLQVAVGLLPLIAAMGVVELRAHRFVFRARGLMAQVRYPREFAAGVRWIVARDVAVLFLAVSALGAVLLAALTALDALTPAGVMMIVAGVFLAGAYYVSFLLTGMAKFGQLCVAVGLALGVHVAVLLAVPAAREPLVDTTVFAGTALLLLVVSLSYLLPAVSEPRTHA